MLGGGGGGADDKFIILVVKMVYGRCLHSTSSITLSLTASCDTCCLHADISPYTIFTTRITDIMTPTPNQGLQTEATSDEEC